MKRCGSCGESKPADAFARNASRKDGLQSRCRQCVGVWYEKNATKVREQVAKYVKANRALVSERRKTFATKHRDRLNAERKGNYAVRREDLNARRRERSAADPAYREALAERKRAARRAADPRLAERDAQRAAQAALKADHRAHVDARQRYLVDCSAHVQAWRDWKAAQPRSPRATPPQAAVYERAKSAFRRARRLGRLAPRCTIGDTLPFYERAADLERITGVDWNVDHRVPLRANQASGLHCPANLQVLPRVVNEGKSNFFSPEHA